MTRGRRRSLLPEGLEFAVRGELARLGQAPTGSGDMTAILGAWPAAVGEAVARNAWPARFARDGTLIVHASSSAWAFELTQLADKVCEQLGPVAPPKLRFLVGPLPADGPEAVPEVQEETLSPGAGERERAAEIARVIEHPELREAVARAAAASLARTSSSGGPTASSDTLPS
jgi:hypothetical protein